MTKIVNPFPPLYKMQIFRSRQWLRWLLAGLAPLAYSGCAGHMDATSMEVALAESALFLSLPVQESVHSTPTPSFTWAPVEGAAVYKIEIAKDHEFEDLVDVDLIVVPHYAAAEALPEGELFWRVQALDREDQMISLSETGIFRIEAPASVYTIADGADAKTIEDAIREAAANTPSVVRFAPAGQYRLAPSYHDLIRLDGIQDLIIDGRGAEIVFTEPASGLALLKNCRNILIRDLTVRFDPMPHAVGVIRSVDHTTGKFTLSMDDAKSLAFDDSVVMKHWTWGVLLDKETPGKLQDDTPLVISTKERQVEKSVAGNGDVLYTLQLKSRQLAKYFEPGYKYIVFARNGGRGLARTEGGSGITFLNVTNYGVSGGHYTSFESSGLKVLGCRSLIPEGYWFGANADGLHVRSNDLGPWVEGCHFEGVGDDAIAIYAKGVFILGQDAPDRLRVDAQMFNLEAGHEIRIFNPREGTIIVDAATIASIEPQPAESGGIAKKHFLVTLETPLDVTLDTSHSDPLYNDQLFNNSLVNRDFAIRNNVFKKIRRFGSVVRARSGVIENNTYEQISNIPIVLRNEPDLWRNGLNSERIFILNNKISDSGFVAGREGKGQINVVLYKMGHDLADGRGHRSIVIDGNEIRNWQEVGISIQNAQDVRVTNNRLIGEEALFNNDRKHYGIYVNASDDVEISGNRFEDRRILDAEIEVTENTDGVTVNGARLD